jgi:hypothetical protein
MLLGPALRPCGPLRLRFKAKTWQNTYFLFERLDVWQLTVDLAESVLALLEKLPQNKHIRLISQMEATVTSPAQNIVEGKGR